MKVVKRGKRYGLMLGKEFAPFYRREAVELFTLGQVKLKEMKRYGFWPLTKKESIELIQKQKRLRELNKKLFMRS